MFSQASSSKSDSSIPFPLFVYALTDRMTGMKLIMLDPGPFLVNRTIDQRSNPMTSTWPTSGGSRPFVPIHEPVLFCLNKEALSRWYKLPQSSHQQNPEVVRARRATVLGAYASIQIDMRHMTGRLTSRASDHGVKMVSIFVKCSDVFSLIELLFSAGRFSV